MTILPTINKRNLILIGFLALMLLTVFTLLFALKGKGLEMQAPPPATEKIQPGSYPAPIEELIEQSKSEPAGAQDSYYLLKNEQMVIAYNKPENTFIVTANGKSNFEIAKKDSQAYLRALGLKDLTQVNLIYRYRGEW